jgi:hypothetical protein
MVQQGEDPQRAIRGDQVKIRHAASKQRVSLAQVVVKVQAGQHPGEAFAGFVHAEELGYGLVQGLRALVLAAKCD